MPIIRSIYWEQNNQEELVYKFPFNNISYNSVLTVNESQEALFYKSGALVEVFKAGRHTLNTSNFPVLSKIVDNTISGGETTFLAEIWFVSLLEKRNILWGAGSLRIIDPYFQIPIKISARGQYGIRIIDSSLFVKKVIGTVGFASTELVEEQFRIDVIEAFKVTVSTFMKDNGLNVNEIVTEFRKLSEATRKSLQQSFDEYGVELLNFNIEDIGIDENDRGYQTVMEGVAEQAKLAKLGVNYVQNRQLDIAQTAAGNEGAGNMMGVGMGLGVGQTVGAMVSNNIQQSGAIQTPVPPPIPEMSSFYVAKAGQTTGPFRIDVIKDMIEKKDIERTTYIYKVGGDSWIFAKDDPEINKIFNLMAPPPPPPTSL